MVRIEIGPMAAKVFLTLLVALVTVKAVKAVTSCRDRCGHFNRASRCQCNSACARFGDCCHDYLTVCNPGGRPGEVPVTKQPILSRDISRLADSLWAADSNRLPGMMYSIRKQSRITHVYRRRDTAPKSLFFNVLPAALYGQTITPFRALLNNYERSAGVPERNTITKQREISEFLEAIFSTDVIQTTYNLLHNKGHFASQAEFKDFLNATWFGLYSRSGGVLDSSAFEHTFVGEMKNGAVTGFHNWIQFCLQERAGNLNYYGYTREKQPNQLLLQFNWLGQVKTRSSIMHGVSPEFELALFTTCYIAQPNNLCRFTINDRSVAIRTWKHEGDKLGAAYFYV
ncbi:uridylate-specific endoribonuclease-like [Lytechinus pictus]|uniref:uridylate-specific endoribonuclease-like n=1 Tax=Lytechinus pictus TaxID=7653 RepID=UPI0030B9B572